MRAFFDLIQKKVSAKLVKSVTRISGVVAVSANLVILVVRNGIVSFEHFFTRKLGYRNAVVVYRGVLIDIDLVDIVPAVPLPIAKPEDTGCNVALDGFLVERVLDNLDAGIKRNVNRRVELFILQHSLMPLAAVAQRQR